MGGQNEYSHKKRASKEKRILDIGELLFCF
jgi:hypothetical protein